MQLAIILAVVATLTAAEYSPRIDVHHASPKLTAIVVMMGVVVAAARMISTVTVQTLTVETTVSPRILSYLRRLVTGHTFLWLAAVTVILTVLDWPNLVVGDLSSSSPHLTVVLVLLTPIFLPLVLSWAAFYDVDCSVGAAVDEPILSRWQFVWLRIRHYLILPLIPVLLVCAAGDVAQLCCPTLLRSEWRWLVGLVPLAGVIVFFPLLLKLAWATPRLPAGKLRFRLETFCRRRKIRVRDIVVWLSHGRLVNAAVCGLVPHLRYVLLSDELIKRLPIDDIEAVFAHELGHVRHRHALRMLLVLSFPLLFLLTSGLVQDRVATLTWLHSFFPNYSAGMAVTSLTAMSSYLVIVVGGYARLIELQADLWAVEQLADDTPGNTMRAATCQYLHALDKLSKCDGRSRPTIEWLHPSLQARKRFLKKAQTDRRSVRWLVTSLRLIDQSMIAALIISFLCNVAG